MNNPIKISKALSDKNRLKILDMLADGDRNVGEVAEDLNVEENLASHHLRVLSSLGFLKSNKKGREVFYGINRAKLISIIRELNRNKFFSEVIKDALS